MDSDLSSFVDDLCAIVCDLKEKGIVLNSNGIFNTATPIRFLGDTIIGVPLTRGEISMNANEILNAAKILPYLVERTTRKFLVGSYGLKHTVEKTLKCGYISNGYTILAMLYLKYDMKLPNEHPINCSFACKYVKSDASIKPPTFNLLKL